MKIIFLILVNCLLLQACSVKSVDQSNGGSVTANGSKELKVDPNADSDGDKITDGSEIARGSDPLVADVPVLESSFIQNFTINVDYNLLNDEKPLTLQVSTKIKDTDSSFNYRVGKLFGVDNSMYYAAKEGRFSGHSYGNVKNEDFSWVKYPTLDPLMLHSDIIKFRPILDGEDPVTGQKYENFAVKISLSCSVKLAGVRFQEIKDLSVNFYYHDFEKDSYVLLKNVLINRTFQKNINENFSVDIENVPVELLRDSYLKHGEFLISEVDNYNIPELNTDYKTLMSSVKSQTMPVLVTTPTEDKVSYVATNGNGISFLEVMKRVFVKNYEVENNVIKRIGQYENNLGTFEYLAEVKNKDKLGKWFILTNQFKDHFMDHRYQVNDHITLSYITGKMLAAQPESIQASYKAKVSTEAYNEVVTPLGVVSPNSKVEIQLKGLNRFGHEVQSTPYYYNFTNSCSGNCTRLQFACAWVGNKSTEFSRDYNLTINYNEEWEKTYLVINEERFKLSTLIAEKKVIVRNLGFSYQISIDDISKIKPIKQAEENNLSLVTLSTLVRNYKGLKLISQTGAPNMSWCTMKEINTVDLANKYYNSEISKGDPDVPFLQQQIAMYKMYPNSTYASEYLKIRFVDDIDYEQNFSLAISTRIINYFN